MRTLVLLRGDLHMRNHSVKLMEKILNPDVNNVCGDFLNYSDFRNNQNTDKEAFNTLKKRFKISLTSSDRHIIVNGEFPGPQSWNGFIALANEFKLFTIGINYDDNVPYNIKLYDNPELEHIEMILRINYIN